MKLSPRDSLRYFEKPDPQKAGLLLYGPDAMRISLRRDTVVKALIGPNGDDEMRLTRIDAAELRKDKSLLLDALKAQGFFPGARVALIEGVNDQLTDVIKAALDERGPEDAHIVVTAGSLRATSKLRKLFETRPDVMVAAIYADPPSRDEIMSTLNKAGLTDISRSAQTDLELLAREIDPGDFAQTIEKLSLYKLNDPTPVESADVEACAPATSEAQLDDLLHATAEGRSEALGPLIARLKGQGTDAVALSIMAMRHFRTLHAACSDPSGPAQGIGRLRPPVFGPRRDRMVKQAQSWGIHKLETAIGVLTETDLTLRSSSKAPTMAVIERSLIRLSMLAQRR